MEQITIKTNKREMSTIQITKLWAIEIEHSVCKYYYNDEILITFLSLREALAELPVYFVRLTRTCAVNAEKVAAISYGDRILKLTNGKSFHFSVRSAGVLNNTLNKLRFNTDE
ncbi:MAG: LytTR family transcriptional regulator DNA-binding domain-containing protein [Bacteroidales bacterium]|jgi:hypothetical protein|nr:LytTR family transcriptional regulator DNA-binding domain-containing protein [Bacteroidales bacterium]